MEIWREALSHMAANLFIFHYHKFHFKVKRGWNKRKVKTGTEVKKGPFRVILVIIAKETQCLKFEGEALSFAVFESVSCESVVAISLSSHPNPSFEMVWFPFSSIFQSIFSICSPFASKHGAVSIHLGFVGTYGAWFECLDHLLCYLCWNFSLFCFC